MAEKNHNFEDLGRKPRQPGPGVYRQTGSIFFQWLPQELRDEIYFHLFSSTRFAWGMRMMEDDGHIDIKPAPNGLALLRVCRRMEHEIGDSWLSQVLFYFEDPQTLLDKLDPLPQDILSRIRRVTLAGHYPLISYSHCNLYYSIVSVFDNLPGLRLDELTVLGGHLPKLNYDGLHHLIADGSGWKVLRYITFSSAMLGYRFDTQFWPDHIWRFHRKPQPSHWQDILEARDGSSSKPSVTVYRATEPGRYGCILDPSKRVRYEQKPGQVRASVSDPLVFQADPELMTDGEKTKEILVVVKRGLGVDFEETGRPRRVHGDNARDVRSWARAYGTRTHRVDFPVGEVERRPPQVDVYENADEYAWNPLYFTPCPSLLGDCD
ncbi:hypothetical protein B0T22DRAFT_427257 [Podospora appendiculata]|uniref:Uncharacterized protein n=1 Tax=Podospora appendiculata TaxID=314037 RepID=A0AAE0XAN9_9PEZI|nr:hypothetical protein B0T22DRAFT_427257 [Podospora appendiculata]